MGLAATKAVLWIPYYLCLYKNLILDVSSAVSTGGTSSELRYRAASERDYGTLHCRATNAVGTQKKPCAFQIVPAGML